MSSSLSIKNIRPSWIIFLVFIAVTWVNFNQELWKGKAILNYDVAQYYSYLPAVFYEHDLSQSFLKDPVSPVKNRYAPNVAPNGNYVFKMSMGMAISYLPFFGMAHIYTAITHSDREHGFGEAYQAAIQFSSLFYFLAGLFFLSGLLRFFFPEPVVAFTLFCVTFGTNAFYYLTIGAGMSHAVNFALVAAFLYYTVKWYQQPRPTTAFVIGCLGGLLTLIRPINILIYIFFFLYTVASPKEMKPRISFLLSHKAQLVIMAACGILFFMPQLLYWKYISGNYFFNSYVGEHFYFNKPHLLDGLFGFRKGWLIYTPVMALALAGIYFLRERLKQFSIALPVFMAVYLYVTLSWWCWWYGGGFGQRPLIDMYPLMAVPLTALLSRLDSAALLKKRLAYALISCLIALNLFQTVQAKYNIIDFDSMTRENYFRVFFKIEKQPDRELYLKHPDYKKAMRGEED